MSTELRPLNPTFTLLTSQVLFFFFSWCLLDFVDLICEAGVRKEEMKVELEDSRYLIIRTEAVAHRRFSRKFRLPEQVDVKGISAEYLDGVLTVKVPRRGFFIHPADAPRTRTLGFLARTA